MRSGPSGSGFHSPHVGTPGSTVASQSPVAPPKQPMMVMSLEHESATNSAYGDDGP